MEHARGVINRSRHDPCERQYGHVFAGVSTVSAPRVPLLAAHALLRHQVRIGALQSRRHHGLVVIDGNVVLGGRLDHLAVVAHARLTFVPLQTVHSTDDRRYVARLDHVNTVLRVIAVDRIQVFLVVGCVTARLIVSDNLHAQLVRETTQVIHIPVVIGCGEIKMFPVLPAEVPAFGEDGTYTVLLGKTQIPLHIPGCGTVFGTLLPGHRFDVHRPPYTDKLRRADPIGIFYLAGLVQVEHYS